MRETATPGRHIGCARQHAGTGPRGRDGLRTARGVACGRCGRCVRSRRPACHGRAPTGRRCSTQRFSVEEGSGQQRHTPGGKDDDKSTRGCSLPGSISRGWASYRGQPTSAKAGKEGGSVAEQALRYNDYRCGHWPRAAAGVRMNGNPDQGGVWSYLSRHQALIPKRPSLAHMRGIGASASVTPPALRAGRGYQDSTWCRPVRHKHRWRGDK
jgi:hypothetical protein